MFFHNKILIEVEFKMEKIFAIKKLNFLLNLSLFIMIKFIEGI